MRYVFLKPVAYTFLLFFASALMCFSQSDKDFLKKGNEYFKAMDYQNAFKNFSSISNGYKITHTSVAYYEIYCLIKLTALHKADSIAKNYTGIIETPKKEKFFSEMMFFVTTGLDQYNSYLQQSDQSNKAEAFQESLKLLNKALAIDSFYIDAYIKKAYVDLSLDNYKDCINDCDKILSIEKNNATGYYYKGCVFLKQENYSEAEILYTKSLQSKPLVNAYYQRARTYYHMQDYDKALKDINALIQMDDRFAIAYAFRAQINKKNKKYKEAIRDYGMAISFGMVTEEVYLSKAECYYYMERDSSALEYIEKTLSINPNNAYANYLKARCLVSSGDYFDRKVHPTAIQYYDLAIKKDSSVWDFYYYRGISEKMCKRYDDAITDISKAIKLDNLIFDCYDERNTCHELKESFYRIRKNDLYEGINAFKTETRKAANSNNPLYFDMAKCYKLIWDFTKENAYRDTMFRILNTFVKNNPDNATAYYERGTAFYHTLYDYNEAASDLRISLKYDSTRYLTYSTLGWAYMHSGRPEEAYKIFILMKKRFPNSSDVIDPYIAEADKRRRKK